MNHYLLIAGILCALLGIVHSVLGEYMIFASKRKKGKIIPTQRSEGLRERHLRIIWATWHMASFFGWSLAEIIIYFGIHPDHMEGDLAVLLIPAISMGMFGGGLLVLFATKGRHPGWIVLLLIGLLVQLGA